MCYIQVFYFGNIRLVSYTKKYRNCLKIFLVYFILILPITLYIIFNFLMIDENLSLLGKKILLDRIPHHANINSWATYKDIFFLCLYFYSLFLIKNNRRFFIFFSIFGFFPILLSVFQYFINIDSLHYLFLGDLQFLLLPSHQ